MKKILLIGAASLALAACSSGGDADKDGDGKVSAGEVKEAMAGTEMQPGEYEVKITFSEMEAPGMPEQMRTMLMESMAKKGLKTCITEEQAKNPGADMFGQNDESGCKMEKLDRSGNKMNAVMTCNTGGVKMAATMDGTFKSDGYTMNMEQKITGAPSGDMSMKGQITANRIGVCPK